jgi:hypothetical protein
VISVAGDGALELDHQNAVFGNFPLMFAMIAVRTIALLTRAFRSIVLKNRYNSRGRDRANDIIVWGAAQVIIGRRWLRSRATELDLSGVPSLGRYGCKQRARAGKIQRLDTGRTHGKHTG